MEVKIYFSESELDNSDFELDLRLSKKALECFHRLSSIVHMKVSIFKGVPDEAQKEEACNKGVCKQRRHKTVNACKPS